MLCSRRRSWSGVLHVFGIRWMELRGVSHYYTRCWIHHRDRSNISVKQDLIYLHSSVKATTLASSYYATDPMRVSLLRSRKCNA